MTETQKNPDFEREPIVEVVFGVMFKPVALTTAHVGLFWNQVRDEFPNSSDQAPLNLTLENFGEPVSLDFEFSALPPLRRVWLVSGDTQNILQIQADRFHFNRKRNPKERYQRFRETKPAFQKHFAAYKSFVETVCKSEVTPIQYELTYVNHIPMGEGWKNFGQMGNVFPDLCWRTERQLLKEPEAFEWKGRFRLPDRNGRIHVSIGSRGDEDGKPMLQFQITARGFSKEFSDWFDLAHDWVVRSFAELTSNHMHQIWKRTQ